MIDSFNYELGYPEIKPPTIPPVGGRPRKYNTTPREVSSELYDKRADGWRRKYPRFSKYQP